MLAFKEFTADSLRRKTMAEQFKIKASPLQAVLKQIKAKMEDYMILNDLSTAFVRTPMKTPEVTYLQRINKVQCRRISRDAIIEGLETFFSRYQLADLPTSKEKSDRIWECINNARKVDKMVMSVLNKPVTKRGESTGQYVHDASKELVDLAEQYWSTMRTMKALKEVKKQKDKVLKERIDLQSPNIIQTMLNKKRKRQRINIQHHNTPCTFYVKIKVSERRPTLKKENVLKMIMDSVQAAENQEGLVNRLLETFDAIPPLREQRVTLDKGHYMPHSTTSSTTASVISEGTDDITETVEDNSVAEPVQA